MAWFLRISCFYSIKFSKVFLMKTAEKSQSKAAAGKVSAQHNGNDQLHKVFEEELKDIYWAEKHLTKALPKMSEASDSNELKKAYANHLEQTKGHISYVEKVFDLLGKKATAKKCDAMEGLVKEGEHAIEDYEQGPGRDVALIIAAQKIEHYEIAAYGSLKKLALVMGLEECVKIFDEVLKEENNADELLTSIAEKVNEAAYEMENA